MSCEKNKMLASGAGVTSGVMGLTNRWLSTLGSWSTLRKIQGLKDIPGVISGVTEEMIGISDAAGVVDVATDFAAWAREKIVRDKHRERVQRAILEENAPEEEGGEQEAPAGEDSAGQQQETRKRRYPKIVSPFGAMVALHAVEQATGAAGTTAMRLFLPGQAVGNWRNSVIRENRLTPVKAKVLGRLTGGRLLDARGYYFHEGGRTWLSESFTADVKGTPRTLTRVSSLAFPKREHFFDRPLTLGNGAAGKGDTSPIGDDYHPRELPMQSVVDVVKGEKQPSQVPGYIGSTSEVENITGIAGLKRALFAASWFLVDESERDVGGGLAAFDYPAEGGGDYSRYRRVDKNRIPIRPAASYPEDSLLFYNPRTQAVTATPAGGSVAIPVRTSSGETARAVPVRVGSSPGDRAEQAPAGARYFKEKLPYEYLEEVIEDRLPDEKGVERPVLLRGFKQTPFDLAGDSPGTPDAIYHDGERWRQVTDDKDLKDLSRAYQNKDLKVTKNWQEFTAGYPAV